MNTNQPSPEHILQLGLGFWPSKILLAAVRFELFTILGKNSGQTAAELKSRLNLQCSDRHLYDFLDALTGLGFLKREGLLETARYSNASETDMFLDKHKQSYIGGLLEMANNRLYEFWGNLEAGLQTGSPQNEMKHGGTNPFVEFYQTPEKLEEFVHAMSGIQMGNFITFSQKFNFSKYKTLLDVGGSGAMLSIMVARNQQHMQCFSFDLPPVAPVAQKNIDRSGVAERVKIIDGDFFADALPKADIVVMGNILHDWDEEKKLMLIKKAYDALPAGGAFVAIENVIDNDRRQNVFGMMMSLNMLIESGTGFDYTLDDFTKWVTSAGFKNVELMPLTGPTSAAIAYK